MSDGKRVRPSRAWRQLAPTGDAQCFEKGAVPGASVDGPAGHSTISGAFHRVFRTRPSEGIQGSNGSLAEPSEGDLESTLGGGPTRIPHTTLGRDP
jgi:hypothetical protein